MRNVRYTYLMRFVRHNTFTLLTVALLALPNAAFAATLTIGAVNPSNTTTPGNGLNFQMTPNDFQTAVTYTIADAFGSASTISASNINNGGVFSWIPTSADIGDHALTLTATDQSSNTATAHVTISVLGPPSVTISGQTSDTVMAGYGVAFTALAHSIVNPTYSITDSFSGSISASTINSSTGYFNWTTTKADVGTHKLTITAVDSQGHSATVQQTITVSTSGGLTVGSVSPGANVLIGTPVSFSVSASGFSSPWYSMSDSFLGTSIGGDNISSSGAFSWTPQISDLGTHTLTVYATDAQNHSSQGTVTITVEAAKTASSATVSRSVAISTPYPSPVMPLTLVSFRTYANGYNSPTFTLKDDSATSTLTNAAISSSGYFSWMPVQSDIGVHIVTVTVTDSAGSANAVQTITVVPKPLVSDDKLAALQAQLAALQAQLASSSPVAAALPPAPAPVGQVAGVSKFFFTRYLYPDLTSPDVTELQKVLSYLGIYTGAVTGYFDSLTEEAVKKFQAAHNLDQLGVVGPVTRLRLNSISFAAAAATPSTASSTAAAAMNAAPPVNTSTFTFTQFLDLGGRGDEVTALQQKLTVLGIYSGPVTGFFGPLTAAAVKAFQIAHNIDPKGYVGPATRTALNH